MTPTSILSTLLDTAADYGERPALTVLGREGPGQWTFTELATRVMKVAARLTELDACGRRVLLACPTSMEYVPVFYGCMLAGAVPVPVYMPSLAHFRSAWSKIASIAEDSGAAYAVAPVPPPEAGALADLPGFRGWLSFDDLLTGPAIWDWALPGADDLAFLQYTSGSTGHPKGVMVTHGGLVHNATAVGRAIGAGRDTTTVSWLPLYHDMGIIGSLVSPLFWGAHVVKMSPQAFASQPYMWLRAISDFGGRLAYAPNFAYELCVRKITDEQLGTLDLSRWRVAINGAEPIRESTISRFAERFAPAGFRPEHMRFAYGMAEATLVVTTQRWTDPHPVVHVGERPYIRCGLPVDGMTVAIADPETGQARAPGEVGEIWVSGPSVAAGYWQRLDATEETFHARLPGRPEHFLRTGDLGVMAGGGVAVVGRHKDLIVVNGVNHYPQDIEYTVEQLSPAVRGGCTAAFSAEPTGDVPQSEAAVVVAEVRHGTGDLADLVTEIRLAVAREHDVLLDGVFLVEPGSVPKTTSGKIRRRASLAMLLAHELPLLAGWASPALPGLAPAAAGR
ncbi:fatty acyl-AMP ligase [Nonomuraea zeae]|uniref:Fatty acyl-AMP ligase n=1 Tax=Nonomuraea zeae TaxID=1642303 RepID=A0A5S4FH61_9ACTN|nr:fatty acyl-AMP ligase [Nonomuraea zeae]TMR19283.1 fatty acyl-AMP ligase [Nonomuraea zeae]